MMTHRYPMYALTTLLCALPLGCGDDTPAADDASPPTIEALVEEARQASVADPDGTTVAGLWRTRSVVEGGGVTAWADLIWVMGETHGWHVVMVYADDAETVPLVRWDIVRAYETGGPAAASPTAIELDWQDVSSHLTVFVPDPGLLAALGLDDCSVEANVAFSTAADDCGAPFFPFRTCTLMDFVDVNPGGLTFGEPRATDRCVERVDVYEGWTFERVQLDGDLSDLLADRPAAL